MTFEQLLALVILAAVVAALIHGKVRADVVALTGAAALLATGVLRPVEVQGAFASPAIITLASLFVIAYAIELSGLLDWVIQRGVILCRRIGSLGLWLAMGLCGAGSAFLNNTPIVVLAAPVVRDMAESLGHSPKRYLIPLSPQPGAASAPAEDVQAVRAGLWASAGRWDRVRATLAPRSAVRVIWAASERRTALTRRWSDRMGRDRWAARLRRPSRQEG